MSNHCDHRYVGAHVCLVSDTSRRGVLESQAKNGGWTVRFADRSRNIRVADLKVLPSDAASFEPSQAPMSVKERLRAQSSAPKSTRKRRRVAEGTAARDTAPEGTAAEGTSAESTSAEGTFAEGMALEGTAARDTAAEGTSAEGMALEGAAAVDSDSDSDSDCDECPICFEVLDAATAVLLDCSHVFCTKCHGDLSRRASSRQTRAGAIIECPMCRKRAKLTEIM